MTVVGGHATVGRLSNNVFSTFQAIWENFEESRWTVTRQWLRSRDRRPTVKQRFLDVSSDLGKFWKNSLNGHATVVGGHATVGRLSNNAFFRRFKRFGEILKKVAERSRDSGWGHATVGRLSNNVFWTFQAIRKKFEKSLETSKKRCLTVGRRSRDLIHCRVTVQRLFSKKFLIAWNVQKTLFDSRPTVAWPQPLSRDRSATFFKISPNRLKRLKNALFDSRPTVAWPPTTVAWPFSEFFQNFPKSLETSKKRCLTVGRRSRDLNHCRVTVQRLSSKFSQIAWNVEKTLFDSRPTVAWPPTTVTWPFSDFFQKNF